VVTAYKREQKIQDVPIAITTVTKQQIDDRAIDTSNDIERISPNLSAQASGSRSSRPRWFLRGIGSNDPSVNLESPIGIYQDEVYIAYGPLQSFPLFDLERVEVLKGPQGTLWGKNTTGGAIHFVSRKPSFDTSGYAKGTLGNYGVYGAEAGFGGPVIGDWLAARASAYYEEQAGWATNLRDGSKDPQYNDFATRLQLLANVTDDIDVLLSGRFRVLNGGVAEVYPVGPLPGGVIQQYPTAPTTYTPTYGNNPQAGDSFYRGPGSSLLQSRGATATINWHIGDYTATSISAIDGANNDAVATTNWPDPNFDQAGTYSSVQSRQVTQELRLTSPKADRFNWIAGFHYFNWNLFSDAASGTFGPVASRKSFIDNRYRQDNVSYAGFASAKLEFTKALALTGGLRLTYDKKYVRVQRASGSGAGLLDNDRSDWFDPDAYGSPLGLISQAATKGWSQVTFDVTPEYHVTKADLVYARFAKGFRAGTFNPAIIPATGGNAAYLPVVNPETLYDWEVGAKTEWLDGRLVANASLFYYLLQNAQLNVQQPNPTGIPGANTSILQNAAGGNIKGAELEVDALPIDDLKLHGGLGLLKAVYTDFVTFQGTQTVDASGNQFYRTPEVSAVAGADYTLPVSRESAVGAGTDWLFRSRIYHNAVVQNDPVQQTPAYAIGNVEARFVTGRGRFTLQAYVRNVADKSYKVLSQVVTVGAYPTSLGPPRTYGLQFIAKL
jgi:iron complex outermembrane receptor protein